MQIAIYGLERECPERGDIRLLALGSIREKQGIGGYTPGNASSFSRSLLLNTQFLAYESKYLLDTFVLFTEKGLGGMPRFSNRGCRTQPPHKGRGADAYV
ncbi:hypothetical protein ACFOPQ_05255 [Deinococcus antarcticus]|uniref:Uncharacterized protein n=1 Tax=Deinococcus antarcticus TaxID=1298767 RepID=A0ABV8A6K9_9DEIO